MNKQIPIYDYRPQGIMPYLLHITESFGFHDASAGMLFVLLENYQEQTSDEKGQDTLAHKIKNIIYGQLFNDDEIKKQRMWVLPCVRVENPDHDVNAKFLAIWQVVDLLGLNARPETHMPIQNWKEEFYHFISQTNLNKLNTVLNTGKVVVGNGTFGDIVSRELVIDSRFGRFKIGDDGTSLLHENLLSNTDERKEVWQLIKPSNGQSYDKDAKSVFELLLKLIYASIGKIGFGRRDVIDLLSAIKLTPNTQQDANNHSARTENCAKYLPEIQKPGLSDHIKELKEVKNFYDLSHLFLGVISTQDATAVKDISTISHLTNNINLAIAYAYQQRIDAILREHKKTNTRLPESIFFIKKIMAVAKNMSYACQDMQETVLYGIRQDHANLNSKYRHNLYHSVILQSLVLGSFVFDNVISNGFDVFSMATLLSLNKNIYVDFNNQSVATMLCNYQAFTGSKGLYANEKALPIHLSDYEEYYKRLVFKPESEQDGFSNIQAEDIDEKIYVSIIAPNLNGLENEMPFYYADGTQNTAYSLKTKDISLISSAYNILGIRDGHINPVQGGLLMYPEHQHPVDCQTMVEWLGCHYQTVYTAKIDRFNESRNMPTFVIFFKDVFDDSHFEKGKPDGFDKADVFTKNNRTDIRSEEELENWVLSILLDDVKLKINSLTEQVKDKVSVITRDIVGSQADSQQNNFDIDFRPFLDKFNIKAQDESNSQSIQEQGSNYESQNDGDNTIQNQNKSAEIEQFKPDDQGDGTNEYEYEYENFDQPENDDGDLPNVDDLQGDDDNDAFYEAYQQQEEQEAWENQEGYVDSVQQQEQADDTEIKDVEHEDLRNEAPF